MTSPTPEQLRVAVLNTQQRPRTKGARLRDALQHVQQSQTRQSPLAAGFINHRADEYQRVTSEV